MIDFQNKLTNEIHATDITSLESRTLIVMSKSIVASISCSETCTLGGLVMDIFRFMLSSGYYMYRLGRMDFQPEVFRRD